MARDAIGKFDCLCCGEELPAKRSGGGAVSVSCPWCDFSAYAKDGTQAHRIIMGKVRADAPEPAKAAPAPGPAPEPAKAPKAEKKSGMGAYGL